MGRFPVGAGRRIDFQSLAILSRVDPDLVLAPPPPHPVVSTVDGAVTAERLAYELEASISENDPLTYPCGVVRVVRGRDPFGGTVVIEVRQEAGHLTGLKTYSPAPAGQPG